jgi:hypothetical protein
VIRGILLYGKVLDEWLGSKRVPEHAGTVPIPFRCFKGFVYFASREFCETSPQRHFKEVPTRGLATWHLHSPLRHCYSTRGL